MIQEATRPATPPGATEVLAGPSPGADHLSPVRDLAGLSHACLLDPADGRVLAAIGADEGTAAAVLSWGRHAGAVATDRGRVLDDLILTTDAAYHLLRAVGGPAPGPWVYLRVRRDEGNLALARRQLAAVTAAPARLALPAPARLALPAPARPTRRPAPVPQPAGRATSARPWASPPAASPAAPVPTPTPPAAVPVLPAPRTARPAAPPASPPPAERRTTVRDSAGVLSQRWRTDPETLRRVLAGLLGLRAGPRAIATQPEPPTTRSPGATPTRRNP